MLITLMMMSMLMSMMFLMLTHPLSMGSILLTQTIIISLAMGFFNYNYWYAYILFLIMISSMLILFLYMTSVASNEMFKYSTKIMMAITILINISFLSVIFMDQYYMNSNNLHFKITKMQDFNMSLNKFLNFPSNIIFYMVIIYLFITMIAATKITDIKKGPLRQTN